MFDDLERMKVDVQRIDVEAKLNAPASKILFGLVVILFLLVSLIGWSWFLTAFALLNCVAVRRAYLHHRALQLEDKIRAIDPSYE
jgi:hypothetical protein